MTPSTQAAAALLDVVESGDLTPFDLDADDRMGETDCPHGCSVEPDGVCPHGYLSAARTAGLI